MQSLLYGLFSESPWNSESVQIPYKIINDSLWAKLTCFPYNNIYIICYHYNSSSFISSLLEMLHLNCKITAWRGNIQGLEKKGDSDLSKWCLFVIVTCHNYRLAGLWPPSFSLTIGNTWCIKLFPKPVGSRATTSTPFKMWTKHSSCLGFSWQIMGIFSTTEQIASVSPCLLSF